MSKRLLAPLLLFVAAAAAAAAVFLVHRIEARIGPFNEPYVTQVISPNGDGVQDEALVRFRTKQPERLTITLVDEHGKLARTIRRGRFTARPVKIPFPGFDNDGHVLPDGSYRVEIRRAGDDRVYGPAKALEIDTRPLDAELAVARRRGDNLGGLLYVNEGVGAIELQLADGTVLAFDPDDDASRDTAPALSTPKQDAAASLPDDRPRGFVSVRFIVRGARDLDLVGATIVLRDVAGNPTRLPLDGTLEEAGEA
ncbi:MAG: hypothetical protein JWN72_1430 [Thermoleophilia bacterium]|nr:hypothetical protein [Thermoleophilia bacterium]